MEGSDLAVEADVGPQLAVLRPVGPLRLATIPDLHRTLGKVLLDPGRVLVDLSGLSVDWPGAVRAFPVALTQAGGWPAARLVLFGADAVTHEALTALRVPRTVPVAPDRPAAEQLLLERPPRVHRQRELPADSSAPQMARAFVRETCADWDADVYFDDAASVATELVANAVDHTGSPSRLSLNLDARGLWIAVHQPGDAVTSPPRALRAARGHGLHLIAALTQRWGVIDHDDGKTVWACLAPSG